MYFDRDDEDAVEEIASMPEQFRYGVNRVVEALRPVVARGLKAVLLFGVPSKLPKVSMHTLLLFSFGIISLFICDNSRLNLVNSAWIRPTD